MNHSTKLIAAAVVLLVALGALAWTFMPPTVGKGKPAEIIHPVTHERIKTTWDQVFGGNPPPIQDKFTGGGWKAKIPGTELWGYVVNAGEHHPSEDRPPETAPGNP